MFTLSRLEVLFYYASPLPASSSMSSEGLMDRLLALRGGVGVENLVEDVLLLLPPADLRVSRQVCKCWNGLVLALWRSKPGKRRLEAKLREGWRSSDNTAMQLGVARSQVTKLFLVWFSKENFWACFS